MGGSGVTQSVLGWRRDRGSGWGRRGNRSWIPDFQTELPASSWLGLSKWRGCNEQRRGAILTSRPVFSVCPSSVSGESSGRFASPNYPNNYPDNEDCSWGITVPDGFLVKVEFSHFNTERGYDKLRVYDGPSSLTFLLVTLTGHLSTPREVISTGSSLWFNFRSDSSVSTRGFEAHFTAVDRGSAVLGECWKHVFDHDDYRIMSEEVVT